MVAIVGARLDPCEFFRSSYGGWYFGKGLCIIAMLIDADDSKNSEAFERGLPCHILSWIGES
jgi:hypothetical protein